MGEEGCRESQKGVNSQSRVGSSVNKAGPAGHMRVAFFRVNWREREPGLPNGEGTSCRWMKVVMVLLGGGDSKVCGYMKAGSPQEREGTVLEQ